MKHKTLILAVVVIALLVVTGQPLMAQNGNTWNVSYYANTDWSGTPAMGTVNPYIDFNWGTVAPGPGMPSTNWTATMSSSVNFYYTGTYVFQALADDEISLQIDGITYINTMGAGQSGKTIKVSVNIAQGTHNLVVQYRQYTGTAYVYLNWAYAQPGGGYVYTPLPTPMPAGTPIAVDARTDADAVLRSLVGVLLPDLGHQPDHPVRRLHTLYRTEPATGQLLRLRRTVERAQHGFDPV